MAGLITMDNLRFSYPSACGLEKEVLKGINLNVEKGEFLAVIGPNGSGKSTLVKHFNGLLVPTDGKVLVDGLDTSVHEHLFKIRRKVGMLFQNPENQLVSSIVDEDVAFGPENLALPSHEIRKRVEDALEAVGMTKYRLQPVHTLSGGQKQRVAIAGLLAMRPECLVLDEPTSMLDPVGRQRLIEIIRQLNTEGITIILVTHFMEEAIFADRVCIFNNGSIILEDTPLKVFQDPDFLIEQNLEVPQINRLVAMLKDEGFNIPPDILTVDEMVGFICSFKPKS